MSDPLLTYQTPPRPQITGRCTAAWITALVMGILYGLGGLCIGGGFALTFVLIVRSGRIAGAPMTYAVLLLGAIVLCILSFAVTFIIGAIRIRRGSRAWAIACVIISLLNALLILSFVIFGVAAILSTGRNPEAALGLLMYLIPTAINIAAAILLFRALRDLHGPQPPQPSDLNTGAA